MSIRFVILHLNCWLNILICISAFCESVWHNQRKVRKTVSFSAFYWIQKKLEFLLPSITLPRIETFWRKGWWYHMAWIISAEQKQTYCGSEKEIKSCFMLHIYLQKALHSKLEACYLIIYMNQSEEVRNK